MKIRKVMRFCLVGALIYFLSATYSMATTTQQMDEKNEILVTFEQSVTNRQMVQTIDKTDGKVEETLDSSDQKTLVVSLETEKEQNDTIRVLEKSSRVVSVQPNYIYTANEESASKDKFSKKQWNLDYMDVPEAWALIDQIKPQKFRDEEDKVVVATLDTGIYYEHPDLKKNVDAQNCVSVAGTDSLAYKKYRKPRFSHGTATGGIIAATSNNGVGIAGVAAGNNNDLISLMGINVFQQDRYISQAGASTSDIIKGLDYACEKGAKVINMCLGHSVKSKDLFGKKHDDAALEAAINDAVYNKDVVIICSAGNKGDRRPWYPSDFDAVISVINTKQYTNAWSKECKAKGSSYGSAKDISAPGKGVYSTRLNGSYDVGSGTSMAAPAVTGVAALVRYVNPQLSATQVKKILYSTATDLYKRGYDIYTGYGNVNAYRAVALAAGMKVKQTEEKIPSPKLVNARSAGPHAIKVSWKKVSKANGYIIYRANKRNGKYIKIRKTTDPGTLSIQDRGRKFNKKYFYKVSAYGTTKDGKKALSSSEKKASSQARSAVPKLNSKIIADYKTIRLLWKKSKGANGYQIYKSSSKSGKYKLIKKINSGKSIGCNDDNVKLGRTYYYKIRSYRLYKKKRYYSEMSGALCVTVGPKKPSLSITKKKYKFILRWNKAKKSKVSGYKIYRKKGNGGWRLIKTLSARKRMYQDKNLVLGVEYAYKIRSYKTVKGKTIYSQYSRIKKKKL